MSITKKSPLQNFIPGLEKGLQMLIHLLIFYSTLLQQTLIQLLHSRLPFLLLEQHPLVEVLFQLLQILFFDHFDWLDLHLKHFEFLEVGLVDLFELEHLVPHLLLPWVLALLAFNETIHSVYALQLLQLRLELVNLVSGIIHDHADLFALLFFLIDNRAVLLHRLVLPVGLAELFEGPRVV